MSSVVKHQRPVGYPGHTVWGSVSGPVVFVGDVLPGNEKIAGVSVNLNERESRAVMHAWGWPLPEKFKELEEQKAALEAEVERLNGLCSELQRTQLKVVSIDEVVQITSSNSEKAVA